MKAMRYFSVRHALVLSRIYNFALNLIKPIIPFTRKIKPSYLNACLKPLERTAKGIMFDCQMCGQCVLSSTGMACPTNCAKEMRNGPCGGVRVDGHCEVKPEMICVWTEIVKGQKNIDGQNTLPPKTIAPIDRRLMGTSSWARVLKEEEQTIPVPPPPEWVEREKAPFEIACVNRLNGGAKPVVTIELAPPDSADASDLLVRAAMFDGMVDAINITDGPGGNCHMSSVAASTILTLNGYNAVCQVGCRDRNRIAIQGDILGASALGVRNLLCLTGDDVSQGDHPEAKRVFDLDAVSLLRAMTSMRDKSQFASGRALTVAPNLFIGATFNPFVPPHEDRIKNLELKALAGASFFQTQFCFDVAMFENFMKLVREREIHKKSAIIVGLGTLSTAKALAWMAKNVPGVHIPQKLLERIASSPNQKAEGLKILTETISQVLAIEGVAGVHLMGHKNEAILAEAINSSGIRGNFNN